MQKCPKCGYENEMGGFDCPRCGIVYDKYDALLKQEADGDDDPDTTAPVEESDVTGDASEDLPEALKMMDYGTSKASFDWGRVKDAVAGFVVAQKKWLIVAGCVVCLFSAGILIATSGLKGKKGVVSWTRILGEEGESNLLFDYIDLLPDPMLPEENAESEFQVTLCDVPSGTRVRVLAVEGDFLEVEVLEGYCSGEVGYILADQFEHN